MFGWGSFLGVVATTLIFIPGYEVNFCWECWSDAEKKCPYCKTTQRLADVVQPCSDSDLSDSESDNETVEYTSLVYKIKSERGDDNDDDDDGEQGGMVNMAHSSSTYRKLMESFADSSSSSGDEEHDFNLLFKSMISSNASIFTAKTSLSNPDSMKKSNEQLIEAETSRHSLPNTESRISVSHSKSVEGFKISTPKSDLTENIRNSESSVSEGTNSLTTPKPSSTTRDSQSHVPSDLASLPTISQSPSQSASLPTISEFDPPENFSWPKNSCDLIWLDFPIKEPQVDASLSIPESESDQRGSLQIPRHSSSQLPGPSNLSQTETAGEAEIDESLTDTETEDFYPLANGAALNRAALKRKRK